MRVIERDSMRALGGDKRWCARAILVATIALAASASSVACECADRPTHDEPEPTGSTSLESTSAEGASATTSIMPTTSATDGTVDATRFMGVFHNDNGFVPLGREVDNPGDPTLTNVEILANGTARMTMETCSELHETREIEWRWQAHPGPWLEFFPGPDESALRFMALDDLETLRALPVEACAFQFEVDGELVPYEVMRPGRACWVNRCEPVWVVHIDYCEGEEPPSCE